MSEKSYVRSHFRNKRSESERTSRQEEENVDYYYNIAIDSSKLIVDREKAVDELKRLARKSPYAKKRLMDIAINSSIPNFLRERARDC